MVGFVREAFRTFLMAALCSFYISSSQDYSLQLEAGRALGWILCHRATTPSCPASDNDVTAYPSGADGRTVDEIYRDYFSRRCEFIGSEEFRSNFNPDWWWAGKGAWQVGKWVLYYFPAGLPLWLRLFRTRIKEKQTFFSSFLELGNDEIVVQTLLCKLCSW